MNLAIIGTSKITEHHINTFLKKKIKIKLISSSRKKSKNLPRLVKKYNIPGFFNDWIKAINYIKANKKKIDCILISGRLEDNKKILLKCAPMKKKILIEKPVFLKSNTFNLLNKYKNLIFVGYNRLKYKNIIYVKKKIKNKKNLKCIIKIPEKNKKNFFKNSCHVLSVAKYLFDNLKIINKYKNLLIAKNNSAIVSFIINFNNADNFSIEIFDKNKRYLLCPLENLKIYEKIKLKNKRFNRIYTPIIKQNFNEDLSSKFKPGFLKQTGDFLKFIKHNIIPKENTLRFSKDVIKFAEKFF